MTGGGGSERVGEISGQRKLLPDPWRRRDRPRHHKADQVSSASRRHLATLTAVQPPDASAHLPCTENQRLITQVPREAGRRWSLASTAVSSCSNQRCSNTLTATRRSGGWMVQRLAHESRLWPTRQPLSGRAWIHPATESYYRGLSGPKATRPGKSGTERKATADLETEGVSEIFDLIQASQARAPGGIHDRQVMRIRNRGSEHEENTLTMTSTSAE